MSGYTLGENTSVQSEDEKPTVAIRFTDVVNRVLDLLDLIVTSTDRRLLANEAPDTREEVVRRVSQMEEYLSEFKKMMPRESARQVLARHWECVQDRMDRLGGMHQQLEEFLYRPCDIALARGVWDPSKRCPSFLPAECRKDRRSRMLYGQEFIKQACFVFTEGLGTVPDSSTLTAELAWFQRFLDDLSAPRQNGLRHVRSLAFPNFSSTDPTRRLSFVTQCTNLDTLRLGFKTNHFKNHRSYWVDSVDVIMNHLSVLLGLSLNRLDLFLGCYHWTTRRERDKACRILFALRNEMARAFMAYGKKVEVVVILDNGCRLEEYIMRWKR